MPQHLLIERFGYFKVPSAGPWVEYGVIPNEHAKFKINGKSVTLEEAKEAVRRIERTDAVVQFLHRQVDPSKFPLEVVTAAIDQLHARPRHHAIAE